MEYSEFNVLYYECPDEERDPCLGEVTRERNMGRLIAVAFTLVLRVIGPGHAGPANSTAGRNGYASLDFHGTELA
jgi:hypothetical protein